MPSDLSYEGFKNVILSQVKKVFEGEQGISEIYIRKSVKNNDTMLETLIIRTEEDRCLPCLHINDLYKAYEEQEMNVEEIAANVKKIFYTYADPSLPSGAEFGRLASELERVKDHVECRLINGEANKLRLEGCPHKRIGEFAVSYYIRVGEVDHGFYTMQIDDRLFHRWGISLEELHELAMKNLDYSKKFVFRSMSEMMNLPVNICNMFVLTNKEKAFGAAAILSEEVRRKVSGYVGGDYYILPSSIHELIIIPKKKAVSAADLKAMVMDVNRTPYVSAEEFLSDNVYEYVASEDEVKLSTTGTQAA